jgi:hypothetical protein
MPAGAGALRRASGTGTTAGAVLGLLLLTALVLWIAARAVRHMEISYGAEV